MTVWIKIKKIHYSVQRVRKSKVAQEVSGGVIRGCNDDNSILLEVQPADIPPDKA